MPTEDDSYRKLQTQLLSLTETYPPPFIFIHDAVNPRLTSSVVSSAIQSLDSFFPSSSKSPSSTQYTRCAFVDAITSFSPRLLYDNALNQLAGWIPTWEDGCRNWTGEDVVDGSLVAGRFNDSIDSFLHGLSAVQNVLISRFEDEGIHESVKSCTNHFPRMILVVQHAERLKDNMPDLLVPLARLAELSRTNITTIFISELRWDQIRPSLGAAPDPVYLEVEPQSKQSALDHLTSLYPTVEQSSLELPTGSHSGFEENEDILDDVSSTNIIQKETYDPSLRSLYAHFISTLYSICSPFTTEPDELAYVAAARWPGFVQPIIDERNQILKALVKRHRRRSEPDGVHDDPDADREPAEEDDIDDDIPIPSLVPTEEARMRLTRLFSSSITSALEVLYPRLVSAYEWAITNRPPSNLFDLHPQQAPALMRRRSQSRLALSRQSSFNSLAQETMQHHGGVHALSRLAKFILVASFLASTNPAKSDMRMFGRGPDERKKRKRKGGMVRKTSARAGATKVPQRLLGPMTFPLDRMIAILGVLLEENDTEIRLPAPEYTVPGEYTEMEISRTAIYAQVYLVVCSQGISTHHAPLEVNELSTMYLLHRTSPAERVDPSPGYKCGIGYELALGLARDIGVPLLNWLWETA
ncbi:hypothetical protein K474DRAFT_1650853 [Panus rudis PR-1116 ss-1]|nr:hypothetical protein K474DRAFT_1650853 [Panus rudis PR-1116 ss-1]